MEKRRKGKKKKMHQHGSVEQGFGPHRVDAFKACAMLQGSFCFPHLGPDLENVATHAKDQEPTERAWRAGELSGQITPSVLLWIHAVVPTNSYSLNEGGH